MQKTYQQSASDLQHNWQLIDAQGQVLGQLAVKIATWLLGKHKPTYTPHLDNGDFVIVTNAAQVEIAGTKTTKKQYLDHTTKPGSTRIRSFAELQKSKPGEVITRAVYNMLPANRLRSQRMKRLKVYPTAEHPHGSKLAKA